ncbi:hypothetical protein EO244_15030 [Ancylomarina salipaludis]|uniref:Cytochrome c domain-containing protein n=1 Tax=Ancylomarina salipaludis TaxID=2501299 RepID=A0A4Q1JIG7_9BACT|nr:cytochrome c [Ancylomarina salipaludis]RXQ88839.1 hypothetical protein EO244_15030 [Ancylomarina salipaludis]
MKELRLVCILALLGFLIGCSSSSNDDDEMLPPYNNNNEALIAAQNYFNGSLKPIIDSKCVTCHEGKHNKNDAFNFGVFNNARNSADNMYNQVNSGKMPKDAGKLPQSEIDKFKEFMDLVDKI